jgi:outer membrane receptor protein involved in Fe transport
MASSLPLMVSQTVLAQEGEDEEMVQIEEITVTGSRIASANLVSASPVTTITSSEMQMTGITRVEDMLNRLPQIAPAQTSGLANGSTGTATVDLRGLGADRTLVLVNGRRLPSGSANQAALSADLNQVPAALVERVEVLTGGASATYGSDAIAGVVNFITKTDFEGFALDYQYSFYQTKNDNEILDLSVARNFDLPDKNVTDGFTTDVSIMIGANSSDGSGNVTLYAGYRSIDAVISGSRDVNNCALGGTVGNFSCGGSATLPSGTFSDFGAGDGFDFTVQGDQFVDRNGLVYNYQPPNHLQRPDERVTVGAMGHYNFSDALEMYAEVSYHDNKGVAQIAPSGAFFVTSTLPCGNPFLSAQQFQQLCGQFGLTTADIQNVYLGRRNVEGGFRQDTKRNTSNRIVLGARGEINEAWSYDVHVNGSQVAYSNTYLNDLSTTRVLRALNATTDANGNIVCQSVIDGSDPSCIPWNVFTEGAVTPGTDPVLAYLQLPLFATGEVSTDIFSGYVSGDLTDYGWKLPGADNGVQVVGGYEYRQEKLTFDPDIGYQTGDGAGQGGATVPVAGSFAVKEIFLEAQVPLFSGYDIAESVNLNLGYRYSDYNTDKTTDTYKGAFDWSINDSIRLRASYQRAVRAGNLRELFQGQGLNLFDMPNDPCGAGGNATLQQCVDFTGLPAALYGSAGLNSPANQYNFLQGGNPDLDPEESDTVSAGGIWSPGFVDGLTVSVDWFNINVDKAIDIVPSRFTLDQCLATGDATFCNNVNRAPGSGSLWLGTAGFVVGTNVNIGFFEREGVDLAVNYSLPVGDMGDLDFGLLGTYLLKADTQPTPSSDVVECKGLWENGDCSGAFPDWNHTFRVTWATPWDADITAMWRYTGAVEAATPGSGDWSAYSWLDLAANWQVTDSTQLRIGFNNVLDKDPPYSPDVGNAPGNGNVFPGYYDSLGRYIFAGISLRL